MRFKLDENLGFSIASLLTQAGHDVDTLRDEGIGGATDDVVFHAAAHDERTLITLDLDFANPLRFAVGNTPGVIVIRTPRPVLSLIVGTVQWLLPHLVAASLRGKLWIVEVGRIREHAPHDE